MQIAQTEPKQSAAHILVVDDDTRLRKLLHRYLKDRGFMVTATASAEDAERHMSAIQFDLIILDVMMPGQDGVSFAGAIRKVSDIPILMLTAMGEPSHRIKGLEQGVDDYMGKPFEPKELLLRVDAILRRTPPPPDDSVHELCFGECQYDVARGILMRAGTAVHLTVAEADLLRTLATKANEPVHRTEIGNTGDRPANPRTIDVQVTRLRRKIEPDPRQPRYLQTVRGTGYLLRTD